MPKANPRKPQQRAKSRHSRARTTTGPHITASDPPATRLVRSKLAGVPMGRLADTISKPASGRQYTCKIDTLCSDDDDRKAVASLMSDPDLSVRSIARTLGVSEGTAFKHRSKLCQCYKAVV